MDINKAKKVVLIVAEIERIEKKIDLLGNTEEFCNVSIKGENGGERSHTFHIQYRNDQDIIDKLRPFILSTLKEKLTSLEKDLKNL
ncbi:MAG: hypothetical protein ACEPOW_13945 [Bacteroidales bacterium]